MQEVENVTEFDEDTAIKATGALLCWGQMRRGKKPAKLGKITEKDFRDCSLGVTIAYAQNHTLR